MACRLAWLHWTPHSNAQPCSTLSSHSRTEGTAHSWSMLFSGQKAEVPEAKPIPDSTFKASAQTGVYISSSHTPLAKANHLTNSNKAWRGRLLMGRHWKSPSKEWGCVVLFREESMELGKIIKPKTV